MRAIQDALEGLRKSQRYIDYLWVHASGYEQTKLDIASEILRDAGERLEGLTRG